MRYNRTYEHQKDFDEKNKAQKYLTEEDAYEELNNKKQFKEYYQVVKLIACLDGEIKQFDKEDFDYQTYIEDYK